jgi:hypothetical protein
MCSGLESTQNSEAKTFTPPLDVGIGAWNQELKFAGTNTILWMSLELEIGNVSEYRATFASLAHTLEQIRGPYVWMSLELEIGNVSEYRAAFASLAHTLEQIGGPYLGIAMHLSSRPHAARPLRRAAPPSLSLRRQAAPPSHSFPLRPAPLCLLLFLAAGAPPPLSMPRGGERRR